VHGGMAVLSERGGGFSRIVGPGDAGLGAFERVRAVIDLRTQHRKRTESAYTKDGIEVKTETTVSFRLMKQKDGETIVRPPPHPTWSQLLNAWLGFKVKPPAPPDGPPASPDTLRALVYEMPAGVSWDVTVTTGLADLLPEKMLDELWAPEDEHNPRRDMVDQLFRENKESLRKRGVELVDLTVGPLDVTDKAVDEQRRAYWQSYWSARADVTRAEGEAEALRRQQTARAEAQAELIEAIAQSFRMMSLGGSEPPSPIVALKMLEVIGNTMKAALNRLDKSAAPPEAVMLIETQAKSIAGG